MKRLNFPNRDLERKILSISHQFGYVGIEKANAVWLENSLKEPAFEFVRITPSNIADARPILTQYQTEYSSTGEIKTGYSNCLELLKGIVSSVSPETLEFFERGITFCPRLKLPELFEEAVAPIFFGTFEAGEIIIAKTALAYCIRASFQRLLYTSSLYPDAIISGEITNFVSLRNWNSLEPNDFLSIILRIAQYLFFPYVSSFMADHGIGLTFIFIPCQPFKHARPPFPADHIDFLRSNTEFAEESASPVETTNDLFKKPQRSIYGKYVFQNPPLADDTKKLMEWAIQSANTTVERLYNVTNFLEASSPSNIDPVYALEYAHSFMHILRDAASIIAQDSRYRNKATTFRIADILSAMAGHGSLKKQQDKFFRGLFRCDVGKPIIKNVLYSTGLASLKTFAEASDQIYENLKSALLKSVFIPSKRQSGGVSVKSPRLKSEQIISEDEFCGYVLRALRNTQHGYFTRGDRSSKRPARFLSLIDGNIPDDFSTLALAWALALLASPTELVGEP